MSERPISLSKARKERERREARTRADANAVKFGRSKAEKVLAATRAEKARRLLDQHKRDED